MFDFYPCLLNSQSITVQSHASYQLIKMNITTKTNLTVLLLIISFSHYCKAQGFRNYPWETHKSVVVSEEGNPIRNDFSYKKDFIITYENVPISGIDISHKTSFYFSDLGTLQSADYTFNESIKVDKKLIIKKLTSIYGQPQVGNFKVYWPYRFRFSENKYSWQKGDTRILLGQSLTSETTLYIQYYSEKFYQKQLQKGKIGL